ncbi:hypothetical protein Sa4125_14140 [Aureimonas sp. SA4125]|uniref:hypothetical protein n=1 Tax=Aureimonas sp. SA4125 TaxID=2826993 RepID=UPI001CC76A5B|nr:hypothetical protein [Aureimonas sp. SA4125]BDA83872.1 hypothetical protein Sa4125_14140 [Aureimonas sp. SA4125]
MSSLLRGALNEAQVISLARACEIGSTARVRVSQRDWFDEMLSAELYRLLPGPTIEALSVARSLSRSALLRARGGELTRATADLDCASRCIERIDAEPARRLGAAFADATRAYLCYREGHLDDALSCLKTAYLDDLHVERCGVGVLLMHRVQLINNMIRIETRRGAREIASGIGARVLTYLERPDPAVMLKLGDPWSEGWRPCLSDIPKPLICQMHGQIASEHVLVGGAAQTAIDGPAPDIQVALWATVDLGLRNRMLHEVADDAARLLSRGARPSLPLWRDVATRIGSYITCSRTSSEGTQ